MTAKCRSNSRQMFLDHLNHGEVAATEEMDTVSETQKALFKYQAFARRNDKKLIGVFSLVQIQG